MLTTEKEAIKKWCPHVRIAVLAGNGGASCNTHPEAEIDNDCRCVGSRCAMWRWSGTHAKEYATLNGEDHLIQSDATRQGFCGLAGKPLELG